MQVETLGNGQFIAGSTKYIIKNVWDRHYGLSMEELIEIIGVNPYEFLPRLHSARMMNYQRLMPTQGIPNADILVELTNMIGFRMPFRYFLRSDTEDDEMAHETSHEAHQFGNPAFGTFRILNWRNTRQYAKCLPVGLARDLESVMVEGMATFISHHPVVSEITPELEQTLVDELSGSASTDYQMRDKWSMPAVFYDAGYHMFERIQKAGEDVVKVGMEKDPLQFLKIYQNSSKTLGLKPIITLGKISEIIPPLLKLSFGQLVEDDIV